ncbi:MULTISPECIES: hypothetical protein [unclassified Spirosoma]|uniref:hypothetical protein n=1 Tax=unclassified Spirosoma TaxID=2621999 RepID=UPI00095C249B|nr:MULTISPECIES: hypothetical protein [unclassified Spirosoma]MBN8826895.1 hypothetical protein [Spirosoma sp.]OJW72934.1 MAG: hypothetical protein BGO59_09340 [Spirosoma sp. 48-14]
MNRFSYLRLVFLINLTSLPPVHPHWCKQPTRQLRWLNQLIQQVNSWPSTHGGWEVHQARYQGKEVFVLHLCRHCGRSRGFFLYNHYGSLLSKGDGTDTIQLATLTQDRLLAAHPGRFSQ